MEITKENIIETFNSNRVANLETIAHFRISSETDMKAFVIEVMKQLVSPEGVKFANTLYSEVDSKEFILDCICDASLRASQIVEPMAYKRDQEMMDRQMREEDRERRVSNSSVKTYQRWG